MSVELKNVKKDAKTIMNKLTAEVNVQIADEIREKIKAGEWPINKKEASAVITKMISDHLAIVN